jgi:hypothetical protein
MLAALPPDETILSVFKIGERTIVATNKSIYRLRENPPEGLSAFELVGEGERP